VRFILHSQLLSGATLFAFVPTSAYARLATAPSPVPQATQEAEATVGGSWQLSFTDEAGNTREATLTLQQQGSALSGTFQGQRGSAPISGTVNGSDVSIAAKAHGRAISLMGKVEGNRMSGTMASGAGWTAVRQ
jgi:hypothetical protein